MTLTLTIDGTDVTDKVRLEDLRLEMGAVQGQVATGAIDIDDTTGTADLAPVGTEWSVTESDATPTTIAGGFVGETRTDKGPLRAGTQRQFGPVLEDWNRALTDRVLKGAAARRPAETDYQRISWLLGTNTLGMLDGTGQVPNTNTVEMDRTNYRGKTPLDVLDDCAESANKNFYIYYESGTGWVLYYDRINSTESAFTSSLKVSDDPSDIDNSSVFGPSEIDYEVDPERVYSGLYVKWAKGWVYRSKSATETAYRRLQRTVIKENIKTAKRARQWADRQLDKLDEPTKRLELTVSVPGSALGQLRAGMRIQVKVRSRGITAYTYFRIASIAISPRAGQEGVTDVAYDVRLKMRDKIRPVNLDDTYGGGDSSGGKGTGGDEPSDDDAGGEDTGGDTASGAYVLDDFTRPSSLLGKDGATPVSTTVTLGLPDGSNVIGRTLVVSSAHQNRLTEDFTAEMAAFGFEVEYNDEVPGSTGEIEVAVYRKYIDQDFIDDNSLTGTDDELVMSRASAATLVDFYVELLEGLADESLSVSFDFDLDPGSQSPSWLPDNTRYLVTYVAAAAFSGSPGGGLTQEGSNSQSGFYTRHYSLSDQTTALDPGALTSADGICSLLIAMRTTGFAGGWGTIPLGEANEAPWEGGNAWTTTTYTGTATFALTGTTGTVTIGADNTLADAYLTSDSPDDPSTEPWGPWADNGELLIKWKANPLGDTSDSDPNALEWRVTNGENRSSVIVLLGDAVSRAWAPTNARGIVLKGGTGTYSSFIEKTLAADTYYYLRFDYSTNTLRARLWPASESEPAEWDVTLPKVDESGLSELFEFVHVIDANDGMVLTYDQIDAKPAGGSGFLPPGNGATVTWTIVPWLPGTLRVWVDGIQTPPASVDRDAGTFTFDRPPEPGATIRAEFTPE